MSRITISVALALAVSGLFAWQWSRERQASACQSSGGVWNGPKSRCDPPPGRPILRRDIERS